MNVTIIIPNYNGEQLLQKNLPKVVEAAEYYSKETKQAVEIIIVDDCSNDNSIEYIKTQISKIEDTDQKLKTIIQFFQNDKNLGFSQTVNRGAKEAKGDIVVLLNTDVVPEKVFLNPLIQHFKDEKVFAVGCMDKSIEHGEIILRGRGVGKWQRGFLVHARGEVDKTNTLWVNGGSGAFKKSIWDKLGGFDDLYSPFYWEDIDLSYRALKSGYKIIFEPKSIVIHEHEKGAIKSKYSYSQIKTIAYRNQFIFVWKNVTDFNLIFLHIFWLPYHLFKSLLRKDLAFILGFFNALIILPKIVKSRSKSKNFLKICDKKITINFI